MLANKYKEDLPEQEQFQNECFHFIGFVKSVKKPPKTIVEACKIIYDNRLKEVYPYVDIALTMFFCFPATNCSAERLFSAMRRVKSCLRANLSDDRFNWLAFLTIESDITRSLDFDDIINYLFMNSHEGS